MKNKHRTRTARLLTRAIVTLATLDEERDVVKGLIALRDRWSAAHRNADGCCKRWLSSINGKA